MTPLGIAEAAAAAAEATEDAEAGVIVVEDCAPLTPGEVKD